MDSNSSGNVAEVKKWKWF